MLEVLNSENGESKCCPNRLFKCLIKASNWMDIQPDPHVTCDRYSSTSLWYSSIIRGTSVHHNLQVIAIATKDDIIEIRNVSNSGIPQAVLKDKRQYCISCLEWAPLSNNLLAVGVTGGVIIWHIDLNTRPVSCFISCFPGRPIVSLSWSPQGNLLACGTPTDSTLMIWNVTLQTCTRLKRNYGGGVSHVSWSPDGGRLLVSYQKMFRVWETTHWTCDRWTQLAGRCNVCGYWQFLPILC
jgi:aladin